ncbi:MAG: PIG-L family deacetylase [Actinomycetota bacterium]|nr:PIG-L family deacetylase [Actinomycetota bacterium]
MTRRLAAVFAHPDDDTFGVGGTLALNAGKDLEVMTVLATSGEAGPIADPALATRENLGPVREVEARESYRVLGFPDVRLEFLRYADGGLAGVERDELVDRVASLLVEFGPDVVVTFGPEGVTKHEDHVTMHHVGTEAFHRARERAGGKGFRRLLNVAIPTSRIEAFREMQRAAGMEPFNPEDPFMPRGVPDETIGLVVDCSSVWRTVYEALRAHRTQAEEIEAFPEAALPEIFGTESYIVAWPLREPGDPVLTDVFQGLLG